MATVDAITNPDKMFTDGGIKVIIARVTQVEGDRKTVTLAGTVSILPPSRSVASKRAIFMPAGACRQQYNPAMPPPTTARS